MGKKIVVIILVGLFVISVIGFMILSENEISLINLKEEINNLNPITAKVVDPIRFNSTYKHYGWYPQQKIFTNWDGLRYTLPDHGGIQVLDQGNMPVLTYGWALSADFNGSTIIRTELDFEWTWTHTTEQIEFSLFEENETEDLNEINYVMTKHIFERTNDDDKFPITERWEFDPISKAKQTHFLTNDFNNLTNFRFWYVLKNPGVVRFDGQLIDTRNANVNRQGNFNNILSRIEFPAGSFLYNDLIENEFDLRNIRIGDGEIIGFTNVSLIALGFTKNNGNFPKGITVELDPSSSGFKTGTSVGDPAGSGWTNPDNSRVSNNIYATSIAVGSVLYTKGYSFGIPADADILGFEMKLEARSETPISCGVKQGSRVSTNMSLNNYTSLLSDTKNSVRFDCVVGSGPADVIQTLGNSTDLWGLSSSLKGSDINGTFRTSLRHLQIQTVPFNPGFDAQSVNIYWETGAPTLSNNPSGVSSTDVVSSTFLVNFSSSDMNLTSAFLESNYTGESVNYTMTEEGSSNNFARLFEGDSGFGDGDEGANNGSTLANISVINHTFTIRGCVGTDCTEIHFFNITTISALPTITLNTPLNGSDQTGNASIIFNVTNTDSDGDNIDLIMVSTYGNGYNIRNYLQFFESVVNGTEATHNQSIGTIDATDPNLVRLYRLDNLNRFNETTTGGGFFFDASNNGLNASGNGGVPDPCTSGSIIPKSIECMEFDGNTESIIMLNGTDTEIAEVLVDLNFSVEAWLYDEDGATTIALGKGVVSAGANAYFWFGQGTSIANFRILNATATQCNAAVSGLALNEWNHVVFTGNGTHVKGYLNGVEVSQTDCSTTVINVTRWAQDSPTYETYIGGIGTDGSTSSWDGGIDEVAIYNKTLTATEIQNHYNISRNPFTWTTRQWDSPLGQTGNNFTFTTAVADSCTYISGDWLLSFADNCVITSNVIGDALAEMLFDSTVGTFTINNGVIISGFDFLFAPDTGLITGIGSGAYLP